MKRLIRFARNYRILPLGWLAVLAAAPAIGEEMKTLWQIGKADDSTAEFALAPDGYGRYHRHGFFLVGHSDPRRDWPYTHPGPDDLWGGGRPHTFTILFGLAGKPEAGGCLDLRQTCGRTGASFLGRYPGRGPQTGPQRNHDH